VTCGNGKYQDPSKAGTAKGNDAVANCCSSKNTCAGFSSCDPGKKLRDTPANTECDGANAGTCTSSKCCVPDTTLCGGGSVTCGNGKYQDPSKAGTAKGNDAVANCCSSKNTCDSHQCSAGKKLKPTPANIECQGNNAGTCDDNRCCIADDTTCGGIGGVSCLGGFTQKASSAGTAATADNKNTVCCTAPVTCETSDFKDPATFSWQACPNSGGGAGGTGGTGGAGGAGGGAGGGGSGTASCSFREVPKSFVTASLVAMLASLK